MIGALTVWVGLGVAVVCALLSGALTGAVRGYAIRHAILDRPNHRSSHVVATPRGGGIAIVAVVLAATVGCTAVGWLPSRVAIALAGGGIAVALAGWIDDRSGLTATVRFAVHLAAAVWAVAWMGGVTAYALGPWRVELGAFGSVIAVLVVVWLLNLYNFMDGIDGIAGAEAVVVGVSGGLLAWTGAPGVAAMSWSVAGAALGFLRWNWSPARIFMGDVGSGFLGFTFAVLALASERLGAAATICWIVLLGVFVCDATVTLARRVLRGERWHEAHHSHAYQRLVQSGWKHARVSGLVIVVDVALALLALAACRPHPVAIAAPAVAAVMLLLLYAAVERRRPMTAAPQAR